jgi:hypothetical protein
MSDSGSIIPISDAQAEAFKEALKTLQGAGGFLREMLGTVPEDLVGLLGGDWLKARRAENIIRILVKAHLRLERGGIKPEPASLSISLPILRAAADESRDELQDLWASLLAAAADPNRSNSFRNGFIDVIKKMDPLDAAILKIAQSFPADIDRNVRDTIVKQLQCGRDAVAVSFLNLEKLGLLEKKSSSGRSLTPLGREFLRTLKLRESS